MTEKRGHRVHLRDIAETFTGFVPPKVQAGANHTVRLVSAANLGVGEIVGAIDEVTVEDRNSLRRALVREGDILINRLGSTTRAAVAPRELEGAYIAGNMMGIRFHKPWVLHPQIFAGFLIGEPQLRSVGSTVSAVTARDLDQIAIVVPDASTQDALELLLSQTFRHQSAARAAVELRVQLAISLAANHLRGASL